MDSELKRSLPHAANLSLWFKLTKQGPKSVLNCLSGAWFQVILLICGSLLRCDPQRDRGGF